MSTETLIESFGNLSVNNKDDVLSWLRSKFVDNTARQNVIKYLVNNEVVLKDMYYRLVSNNVKVTFYFRGYNERTQLTDLKLITAKNI